MSKGLLLLLAVGTGVAIVVGSKMKKAPPKKKNMSIPPNTDIPKLIPDTSGLIFKSKEEKKKWLEERKVIPHSIKDRHLDFLRKIKPAYTPEGLDEDYNRRYDNVLSWPNKDEEGLKNGTIWILNEFRRGIMDSYFKPEYLAEVLELARDWSKSRLLRV